MHVGEVAFWLTVGLSCSSRGRTTSSAGRCPRRPCAPPTSSPASSTARWGSRRCPRCGCGPTPAWPGSSAALVITWANDTAAYFAGRFLGRHKLYPAVSPNKTWEGFFGGMVGSVGGMFIARAGFFPEFTVVDCVVLGVGGRDRSAPSGDLCESMLKRAYGVKDSGKMIPGHGGMLDRIDALLFNAPLVFVYVQFVPGPAVVAAGCSAGRRGSMCVVQTPGARLLLPRMQESRVLRPPARACS